MLVQPEIYLFYDYGTYIKAYFTCSVELASFHPCHQRKKGFSQSWETGIEFKNKSVEMIKYFIEDVYKWTCFTLNWLQVNYFAMI